MAEACLCALVHKSQFSQIFRLRAHHAQQGDSLEREREKTRDLTRTLLGKFCEHHYWAPLIKKNTICLGFQTFKIIDIG